MRFGSADARWVGFLSYDLGRLFERLPSRAADDLNLPLFAFGLCQRSADEIATGPTHPTRPGGRLTSSFSRDAYVAAVARTIEYIAAGDVFQVNLSQRFTAPLAS